MLRVLLAVCASALFSIVVGQSWTQLPGSAIQVSARDRFLITGVPAWVVNKQHQLFRFIWRTESWEKERDNVKSVGAGFDDSAWIVNKAGNVFRYKDGSWNPVEGSLVQVSARGYNEALGVNSNDDIYHYVSGKWNKLPGAATWAAIGDDGTRWVVNRAQQIYRWRPTKDSNWVLVEGAAKTVDAYNANRVVVTNAENQVFTWTGHDWRKLAGSCTQASITAKNVYCINPAQKILKS